MFHVYGVQLCRVQVRAVHVCVCVQVAVPEPTQSVSVVFDELLQVPPLEQVEYVVLDVSRHVPVLNQAFGIQVAEPTHSV